LECSFWIHKAYAKFWENEKGVITMSWQKALILNTNEQVVHSWEGNCERRHKTVVKEAGLIRDRYVSKEA
jgi:hypothetical protein